MMKYDKDDYILKLKKVRTRMLSSDRAADLVFPGTLRTSSHM